MSPATVEDLARRADALSLAIDDMRALSRHNPEIWHEQKSELRRMARCLAVDIRERLGAKPGAVRKPLPKVLEFSEPSSRCRR